LGRESFVSIKEAAGGYILEGRGQVVYSVGGNGKNSDCVI